MNPVSILRRTVLVAVLLVVLACSGGSSDDFEPAPGAAVHEDELEALVQAAVADFGLEWVTAQAEPILGDNGLRSCFQVESGPCQVPQAPSLAVSLHGENGTDVIVRVGLGVDSLEAGDEVESAVTSRSFTETRTLRILYVTTEMPQSFTSGPCRQSADREADEGCAWQERGAPHVGDETRAMKSETLDEVAFSAVAFSRENVFADVEVVARGESDAPNDLADDLAAALDDQIKLALSQ